MRKVLGVFAWAAAVVGAVAVVSTVMATIFASVNAGEFTMVLAVVGRFGGFTGMNIVQFLGVIFGVSAVLTAIVYAIAEL